MRYVGMVSAMVLSVLLVSSLALGAGPIETEQGEQLQLSSLLPGCTISERSTDLDFLNSRAAWLECGECRVMLVHPNNLLQKVRITSEAQALEYVRFFTSPETYDLFELTGDVELRPSMSSPAYEFNEVKEPLFRKYLKPAVVKKDDDGYGSLRGYVVTRYVASLDQNVYELVESVREDGYTYVLTRRFIVKSRKIGIVHLGEI